MADKAIGWLRKHRAFAPDKPFLMYWAPGAGHGPHHVAKEWADKYKGKFNDGWDVMRERTFARQKELGWIPADAQLTPRAESMAAWDSIPASERPFQERLMEVYAGFVEHVDVQAGKVVDELDRLGIRDNTIIFYIWGDNGSSAEGQQGTVSELLAQNNIPNTMEQQLAALNRMGGLDALGGPKFDNMYHAGWAWAGNAPFQHTKLVASHFGGTRNPMAISWPARIKPDTAPRPQFHHVNDIVPTIYEVLGITAPKVVDGFEQDPIDGTSLAYTFADAKAPGRKRTQYFENSGSRGIYQDGWYAGGVRLVRAVGRCRFGRETGVVGLDQGRVGALPRRRGLLAGEQPRGQGPEAARGLESGVHRGSKEEQGAPDRGGQLASDTPGRSHQVALYELAVRRGHHPHARVHGARSGPREHTRHD